METWQDSASAIPGTARADRWEGEDEEENVKDNWDDEDEEEKPAPAAAPPTTESKKKSTKKKLAEKLAAREKQEEMERLEPQLAARQKLLEEKRREEAELQLTKETFGAQSVNMIDPETKDDFDALRKKLVGDLSKFEKQVVYPDFLEDLIQDLCLSLNSKKLKKVKTTVEALYFEKNKSEKKPAVKGQKGKVKLHVEGDKAILSNMGAEDFDDFDDFI